MELQFRKVSCMHVNTKLSSLLVTWAGLCSAVLALTPFASCTQNRHHTLVDETVRSQKSLHADSMDQPVGHSQYAEQKHEQNCASCRQQIAKSTHGAYWGFISCNSLP